MSGMKLHKGMMLMALILALWTMSTQAQSQPTNLIPAPAAYSELPGTISPNRLEALRQKVRISEKALRRRLEGRELADWQMKSAYWLEVGRKGVKIEAADEEGGAKPAENYEQAVSVCREFLNNH